MGQNEPTESDRSFAANERFAYGVQDKEGKRTNFNTTFDRQTLLLVDESEINPITTGQRFGETSHQDRVSLEVTDLNVEKKQQLKDEISECMRRLNNEENPTRSDIGRPQSTRLSARQQQLASQPNIRASGNFKNTQPNSGVKVKNEFLNKMYHPDTQQPSIIPSASTAMEFKGQLEQLENTTERLMVDSDNLLFKANRALTGG